ncbi:MAG: type III pantothenate kinase [Erysipelotrichaceae bacterium]|nr:type III pantothenate kinase [Erysipelotrichaceae bacterium]
MLLTVDAGNTNIAFAIMDGDEIKSRYRLITKTTRTSDEFGFFIMHFLQSSEVTPGQIEDVIISSVVPKLMYALTSAIIKYVHKKPIVISPDLKTGITVVSENRNSVGADRIVNTAWAHHTLHRSAIIVDFGTATTFDYVSAEGEFKYVVIAPGLGISAEALASLTAKLPEIEIRKPASVLGTNTVQGMQAGVVYGYIGAVEYIIRQMKKELGDPECMVVATGGLGKVVSRETDEIDAYDPDIAYKGMKIIYDLNREALHDSGL